MLKRKCGDLTFLINSDILLYLNIAVSLGASPILLFPPALILIRNFPFPDVISKQTPDSTGGLFFFHLGLKSRGCVLRFFKTVFWFDLTLDFLEMERYLMSTTTFKPYMSFSRATSTDRHMLIPSGSVMPLNRHSEGGSRQIKCQKSANKSVQHIFCFLWLS